MRRIVKILGLAMVLTAILVVALAGTAFAAGGKGPALNSGDCVPDGSGFTTISPNPTPGDCISDCVPNDYNYSHTCDYLTPGGPNAID
jgi:hypothetical protein